MRLGLAHGIAGPPELNHCETQWNLRHC
jgi:hypothetical protein